MPDEKLYVASGPFARGTVLLAFTMRILCCSQRREWFLGFHFGLETQSTDKQRTVLLRQREL